MMLWEGISIKSFITVMDGSYYFEIFHYHLIPNARRQFGRRWRLQQDNGPKRVHDKS